MRTFTSILCSIFLLLSTFIVAQVPSNVPDDQVSFVVTSPEEIHDVLGGGLEEIFGSNQNTFGPSGLRGRGNLFTCNTSKTITEHRLFLNLTAQTPLYFCIYEGDAAVGTYNQISSVLVAAQGPGQAWYSSGPINVDLVAGKFYLIYTQWDANANYYTQNPTTPYPYPCSFGLLTAGAGWSTGSVPVYGAPPPATQTIASTAFADPVAYYQTIVSGVVPVELTSFTATSVGDKVELNWQTATETNNFGFDIERKTAGQNFVKVGFIAGYGTTTETNNYTFTDLKLNSGIYVYRLKQIDFDGANEYSPEVEINVVTPSVFALEQNYPNPFNPTTKIIFSLAKDSRVTLKVFDVIGQEVLSIANNNYSAGSHEINFDASDLNSGVYIYRLEANGVDGSIFSTIKKMTLTK